jgi:hypothetical protein
MGIIDWLKSLLGLGETFDTNRDDEIETSDIQDPPPVVSEPNDTTSNNSNTPEKE